ncbi:hypothetical protein BGZ76_006323 [Entomortierella beljakovae]|nr:hypothetical protein BGZ76_006323 [Entomortierella beljakovae]
MTKDNHPPASIEQANVLSYITFSWIQPMLLQGRKQTIEPGDLQHLSENDRIKRISDLMLREWMFEVESSNKSSNNGKPKRPNLFKVLWRCFGLYLCVPFVSGLLESVCKISGAVLLGHVIRFFDSPDMTMGEGMGYAIGLFLITLFCGTVHHHNFFHVLRIGTWTRQGLISLMYRKSLSLSTSTSISTGAVINLISNDLQPFESWAPFGLYTILGPLEMIVVMYFLWRELGVACLAGLLAFALLMPIQLFFTRWFSVVRTKTVHARDDRIRTLSDVFSGIELLKLSAWEIPFQEKILSLRSIEFGHIWKANVMRAINMSIYFFFPPLIGLFAFVAYWLQGKELTPDKVFVSLTLFNILRFSMTSYFPKSLEALAEVRVSVKRITDFLLLPELRKIGDGVKVQDDKNQQPDNPDSQVPEVLVEMKKASFSWSLPVDSENEIIKLSAKEKMEKATQDQKNGSESTSLSTEQENHTTSPKPETKLILRNISISIQKNELLAVVGPVGCGKSSFCMALMQEMTLVSGTLDVGHHQPLQDNTQQWPITISYSAQSPWILAGTIRSNILFGSKFDRERYDKVISACELNRDLSLFPNGDATIIGERGVILSGGQRARVSLARAAYRDSDLYILDDPLSAVDPNVGQALFDNCINGFLKDKSRVLVTHQLQYIKDCKNVIVLEHGQITHTGSVDEVMKEEVELNQLVHKGAVTQTIKTRAPFIDVLREFAKKATVTPSDEESEIARVKGPVADDGTLVAKDMEDTEADGQASEMEKNLTVEEITADDTSYKSYIDFFRIGSTWSKLILTLVCLSAAQGVAVAGEFFLTIWSGQNEEEQKHSYYPTAYGLYCLGVVILTLIRSFLFFDCVTSSSNGIFSGMLDALLRTSIDFFHANPHGRILNRFSKDMANCDELLPVVFFDAMQVGFMLMGSIITVCVINPWVIISIPFIMAGFMGLRLLYMKSSRQVRRIDGQTRSPIYTHLSETLSGLSTIRAFNVTGDFMDEHIKTQEDNGRAFFTYLAMARWLGYRLDAVSALFLGITAIACVAARDTQQASRAGLAMSSVINLSGELQWAIRMSVEAAILMVSVERMMEYSNVKPEESPRHGFNPDGSTVVPNEWPSEAKITFTDVSLTYPRGDTPVLKNITLDIKPGEKVGIVGRTGAGKSSLIGALFRLFEVNTGNPSHRGGISIDGIDISKIGMHDLREKMAIIPQEPFLFRGTLRSNLDPISQHQDIDIWSALEVSELKNMVENLSGGLDTVVEDHGKNFSIGERQLLSLARAILRQSKIIVMDEATANVDLQSDRLIQKAIHSKFKDSTVITIAHRLNTVIGGYDRILVLDQGRVVEFGEPWELLNQDPSTGKGYLRRMVAGTGAESELRLRNTAKEQYERCHQ